MIFFMKEKFNRYFKENLRDWSLDFGVDVPEIKLVTGFRASVDVDDVLAKNIKQVERWHLAFLDGNPQAYWVEYLEKHYDYHESDMRATTFLDLLEGMRANGFNSKHPVLVADLGAYDLGFRYFRFDGCHRTCCAKHLGIKRIPAIVFRVT